MSVFEKGLVTILVCSAVFSLVSIPLVFRWVPRNRVYGFRTRATLSDDAIWSKANAYFGSRFIVASLLSAWVAVALHVWRGLSPETYLKVSVVLVMAPVAVAGLLTGRFIRMIGAGGQSSNSDR